MAAERTYSIPFCEVCPPLSEWPQRSLILGSCPRCGRAPEHVLAVVRTLRARRLLEARDGS